MWPPTILSNPYEDACEFYLELCYSFLINLPFLKINWIVQMFVLPGSIIKLIQTSSQVMSMYTSEEV